MQISNACGSGSRTLAVSVTPPAGHAGQRTGEVTLIAAGFGAVQVINVYVSRLLVSTGPAGLIDTPIDGAGVQGAIPITGWAVDDIDVDRVSIFRDPVSTEVPGHSNGVFVGDAVFTAGVRPDIAGRYPNHPRRERSGWGLQILTNMLPHSPGSGGRGNGMYTFRAIAFDAEGNASVLGERRVLVNNAAGSKPFGTIDTPAPGARISGAYYVVFGWALTPGTATIPRDGSTIIVYIDGHAVGRPLYGNRRQDIVELFPGYTNTESAVGFYILDTRTLANGMHTIAWSVTDDQGRTDGIGSRYFFVQN
jgi:hypothetical protein